MANCKLSHRECYKSLSPTCNDEEEAESYCGICKRDRTSFYRLLFEKLENYVFGNAEKEVNGLVKGIAEGLFPRLEAII